MSKDKKTNMSLQKQAGSFLSKRMLIAALLSTILVLGVISVRTEAKAQNRPTNCTNATLQGDYALQFSGSQTVGSQTIAVNGVALEKYDGNGNFGGSGSSTINGEELPFTYSGTYTVNKDCTVTTSFIAGGPNASIPEFRNFEITGFGVIANSSRKVVYTFTTPGANINATVEKVTL